MLKVLIADDEPKICRMIAVMVPWQQLGYEICKTVHNGLDAYEAIAEMEPDVVITDIRMPELDGIELVRRCADAHLESTFIIISGYKQFEYAHSALKYGVQHYLLKPIDEDELMDTLVQIRLRKEDARQQGALLDTTLHQLSENTRQLQERFLAKLLDDVKHHRQADLEGAADTYHLDFPHDNYRAFVIRLDRNTPQYGDEAPLALVAHLRRMGEDAFSVLPGRFICLSTSYGLLILFNYALEQDKALLEVLRELHRAARSSVEFFSEYHTTVGVGLACASLMQCQDTVRQALWAVDSRLRYGVDLVIEYPASLPQGKDRLLFSQDDESELHKAAETLDSRCFCALSARVQDDYLSSDRVLPWLANDYVERATTLLENTLAASNASLLHTFGKLAREYLATLYTAPLLFSEFERLVLDLFSIIEAERSEQELRPIRLAKKYIREHYAEAMGLEDAADAAGLNASYFSHLFRKETGAKFGDYVIQIRLEQAKKLLVTSTMSLSDISAAIGYTDPKYFSRLFTRMVGLRPAEYRNLHS